jgi:hypothetical protein
MTTTLKGQKIVVEAQLFSFLTFIHDKHIFPHCIPALQRHNTENSQQIFPEKELRGVSLNFHCHVSVSDLYIARMGLPILL